MDTIMTVIFWAAIFINYVALLKGFFYDDPTTKNLYYIVCNGFMGIYCFLFYLVFAFKN